MEPASSMFSDVYGSMPEPNRSMHYMRVRIRRITEFCEKDRRPGAETFRWKGHFLPNESNLAAESQNLDCSMRVTSKSQDPS